VHSEDLFQNMGNKTGYWLASSFSLHDIGLDKLYINAYVENC